MQILHSILSCILILSSFSVFNAVNPIHSVLFLILTFCDAAAILFLFNVDFLALVFIIIYVGAIAILFLFIIMMLNIKNDVVKNIMYAPFILFCIFTFFLQLLFILEKLFYNWNSNNFIFEFQNNMDNLNSIELLGQVLFNFFLVCFLLAGFILLIAMLGSIVLTLDFSSKRKNELSIRQLSRSNNFLIFYS